MRKSKKRKRIIFAIVLIVLVTIFFYRYISIEERNVKEVYHNPTEIEIHIIDVGQSESILMLQGENTMLIDTGDIFSGKNIVKYINNQGISDIDTLIITHFHMDHIGGAHKVISSFNVGKIICMDKKYFSTLNERIWYSDLKIAQSTNEIFHNGNIEIELPYDEEGNLREFSFGNSKIEFLSQEIDDEIINNKSIVTKIEFEDFSALLMGDAQAEVEEKLLVDEKDIDVNLLKVGHHGSRTSTTNDFLEKVNPEYAIISCGLENSYSHPHKSVMDRLNKRKNIKIYRTDLMGSIVVKSDGKNVYVSTEK